MTTHAVPQTTVHARSVLLPYLLGLVAAMLLIQAVITVTGGEVTILVGVLTAIVAAGIAAWMWLNYRTLTKIRFGFAVAHAIAFVVVTTSFTSHAVVRTMALSAAGGLGLLIHLTGVVLGRGWED